MFETNEKVTSPSKETEDKKTNHMEIFELKNLITEKKTNPQWKGSTSGWRKLRKESMN